MSSSEGKYIHDSIQEGYADDMAQTVSLRYIFFKIGNDDVVGKS